MLVRWGGQGSEPWDEPNTLLACVLGTVGLVSFFCFFFLIDLFLFLAVPGLCCCMGCFYLWQARATLCGVRASHCYNFSCGARALGRADFSSCGSWALELRLSSCGAWPQLLCSLWNLP